MASIASQMTLNDGMSRVLKKINSALDTTLNSFEQVQRASGNAVDVEGIERARAELASANHDLDEMAEGYRRAAQEQENLNRGLQEGTGFAHGLLGKITALAGAYIGIGKIKSFVQDAMADATEGLNVSAQLSQSLSNMGLGRDAYDAISAAADQYRYYGQTAFQAAGAEFATYLGDDQAIISMMETLGNYAVGMSGGGELDTTQIVDYATQLGKVLTGSYDGITKKGFELTEVQKEIIENGTDMEKAAVVADVINESWAGLYDTMSNTPAGQIQQLNVTLGEMVENVGYGIYPAVMNLVQMVQRNLPLIQNIMNGLATGLGFIITILSGLIQGAMTFGSVVADNWGIIAPIIGAVAAALLLYNGYLLANNAMQAISNAQKLIATVQEYAAAKAVLANAAAHNAETIALAQATVAQAGLNTAMLASPITWIILAVIALIAVIVIVANQIAKTSSVANTAFGVIAGWINVVLQFFKNLGLTIANFAVGAWNALGALASNMGTAFSNTIANIQGWFYNLMSTVVSVVAKIAEALNKLPFVEFDYSGLVSAADAYAAKSAEAYGNVQEYASVGDAFAEGMSTFDTFQDGWVADAFAGGAAWGDGLSDKLSDAFSYELGNADDLMADSFVMDGLGDNVADIADSSAAAAGALTASNEQLEYLRDIAERDAVNRFTTAEVKIDMTGMSNRIEGSADLDGVLGALTEGFTEALVTAAEGVHV